MVTRASVVSDLQSIVGTDYARAPKDEGFSVDGMRPQVVVEPGSYEEVAKVIRHANDAGLAVIPAGDGFLIDIGNMPKRYDVALHLRRLNQLVEYEPADMTVTCQAGTTVAELGGHLSGNSQMVPFGSGPLKVCTVGGLLAANRSGLRLAYGTPRDFTIGMRVVTADGRITRAGGRVVKNVAGYDLCKLYIGSLGTLGVIVEASLKLVPLPEVQWGIQLHFPSIRDACDFAQQLGRRGLCLEQVNLRRSVEFSDEGIRPSVHNLLSIDLAGSPAAVERSKMDFEPLARGLRVRPSPELAPTDTSGRIASSAQLGPLTCEMWVLPTNVLAAIDAIDNQHPGAILDVSPIEGIIKASWRLDARANEEEDLAQRLRGVARRLGGSLMVTGCSPELKRRIDVFGDPPPAFELMRRVKHQFDPNGILSPSRFVGKL